jgi:hemolysin activation/secretion protein
MASSKRGNGAQNCARGGDVVSGGLGSETGRGVGAPRVRSRIQAGRAGVLGVCLAALTAVCAHAQPPASPGPPPPSASQVTPRTLRPEAPAPQPLDLPQSAPAQAPKGAEDLHVVVRQVVLDGGYPELEAQSQALLKPVEGHSVSVADLYKAAAGVEQLYGQKGYFLVRILVPQQRVADGGDFHLTVVDGFFEQVDDKGVPSPLRGPVRKLLRGIAGRKKLKLGDVQARLDEIQALPGAHLRSTIAQGDSLGGARLIIDGGFQAVSASLSAENRLGPVFGDWGGTAQFQWNSPTGHGEQAYLYLSGNPRFDLALRQDQPRRSAGGGVVIPLGFWGLELNPEVTVSDTHPLSLFPSHDRLYRGSLNLSFPSPIRIPGGTTTIKLTTDITDENNFSVAFDSPLSHDRLVALRADAAYNGAAKPLGVSLGLYGDLQLSHGVKAFGFGVPEDAVGTPLARGGDPDFTSLGGKLGVTAPLPFKALLNLSLHGQTAFHNVLPSAETFDLSGPQALSSFSEGGYISDAGVSVRAQIERTWTNQVGPVALQSTPYLFAAEGHIFPSQPDLFSPDHALDYGLGLRLQAAGFPLGGQPNFSVEYGHVDAPRNPPRDRFYVQIGINF